VRGSLREGHWLVQPDGKAALGFLNAYASIASAWSGFPAADWIRHWSPVAVRIDVEQQQGRTDILEAKRSPEISGAKLIGCLEARSGAETGVVEVTNARVWRVIPFLDFQWAQVADPELVRSLPVFSHPNAAV
jgi:hypothetical protein